MHLGRIFMVTKRSKLNLLFFILKIVPAGIFFSIFGYSSEKVILTQAKMADLVIKKSLSLKATDLKYEQYRFAPYLIYGNYEWKWSVESGYEIDKTESLSLVGDYRFERFKTVASISKSMLTGTSLIFDVTRTTQNRNGDSVVSSGSNLTAASFTQLTYDYWDVRIEQSLWGNSFGVGDRARIRSADNLYKSQTLLRSDEIQNLVLEGLRLYWDTYVAQENYKEAIAARERYQKLVSTMQRKSSMGYTLPGEVSQVQAEFEARDFTVKSSLQEYKRQMENLVTFLNLPIGSELEFEIPKTIPAIPKLAPKQARETRFIQSQELKIESAEDDLTGTDSKDNPTLNLIAKLSSSGVDESSSESLSELARANHPEAYIGLKLSHAFGSDVRKEEILNRKAALELERVKQQKNVLEFDDHQRQLQRKAEVASQLMESIEKQKRFREKALNDLNRSYTQGRADIRNLIDTMNSYFMVNLGYYRAVGDYFISLNEWAALRDELIKEEK